MSDRLTITVGPRERNNGVRAIIATMGSKQRVDKFDPLSAFHRRKFRENLVEGLRLGEDAHGDVDEMILAAAIEADATDTTAGTPNVVCMADVAPLKTEWHWDGHIPIGGLTIIDGEGGLSKSTLTVDLGARATRGDAQPPLSAPDGTFECCNVLFLSPEDDPSRTLRPRLDAARADVRRVFLLPSVNYADGEEGREIKLPLDVDAIRKVVRDRKVRMVFIDPLTAHVSAETNTNSDSSVRAALMPLNRMAQEERCAVVLVRHLSKAQGRSAMNSGLGSVGILATCRAGFVVAREEGSERIVLACSKMNLARKPKSLAYTVVQAGDTSRIEWDGAVEISADDLLSGAEGKPKQGGAKLELAQQIIENVLGGGPRGSNEVEQACLDAGVSKSTYWNARRAMGVRAEKMGFGDGWLLSLPFPTEDF